MTMCSCNNSYGFIRQKGTSLLEAMISMLLIATLGLSLMIVITSTLNIQRFSVTESWILMNLRNISMTDETAITRTSSENSSVSIPVTKTDVTRDVQIEVNGVSKTISVAAKRLDVSSTDYVSGDGLISLSP